MAKVPHVIINFIMLFFVVVKHFPF